MGDAWVELALILLFILGNGLFAAAEIALVSARRAPIAALAQRGDRRARRVVRLQAEPERFLATIQVGISLLTILAGVLGGAVFVGLLGDLFTRIPVSSIQNAARGTAFVVVTLLVSYFTVVLGELVPKTIILRHPERWALRFAGPVLVLSRVGRPVVALLTASSRAVTRLLGKGGAATVGPITQEEVRWLLRKGHERGVFDATERELITQVFSFADTQVRRAMTARTDIAAIDRSWPQERILEYITSEGYSRYPVYEETHDRIIGVIHTKDVIGVLTTGGLIITDDLIRPPMFVPDSQKLGPLLRQMQQRQEHLAIVLDEFGGTAGLITLEDLLEEIVGEIRDEHDAEAPEFLIDRDGRAQIAGKMPIDEFNQFYGVALDESVADTVGGFVTNTLGRIPAVDDVVEAADVRLRVVAMHENRVQQLEGERIVRDEEPEDRG